MIKEFGIFHDYSKWYIDISKKYKPFSVNFPLMYKYEFLIF